MIARPSHAFDALGHAIASPSAQVHAAPAAVQGLPPAGPAPPPAVRHDAATLVDSYRRLGDVFHLLLAEQDLDPLLECIADAVGDLIPHDSLSIYAADEAERTLEPVLVRDKWAEEIMSSSTSFGEGLTGWAAQHREPLLANQAHLDPRVATVPGTPADEPESLIVVPLIARGAVKGTLNLYRLGEDASFDAVEFELATRFGDAAALALDNAQIRAGLEHQAQTDALTGTYNHRYYHERLRGELERASRAGESVAVLMLDLDDFKHVNDVRGHSTGDDVLVRLAGMLRSVVREPDAVCRVGGEEFAVIVSPADPGAGVALARRLLDALASTELGEAGYVTVSVGVAEGPEHAMNPRELTACAEAAMMTAKAQGKNRVVRFRDDDAERPGAVRGELRSLAHMKLLQSLTARLNRLNDVSRVGEVIAEELHALIDYHNCRVFIVEGNDVVPIAFRGDLAAAAPASLDVLRVQVGEGVTGHVAATGRTVVLGDAAVSELAVPVPGTQQIAESVIAAPLLYGSQVTGVLVVSKLGLDQFDDDDARLVEVLCGHASIALENARLYEARRREAESATALLEFGRALAGSRTLDEALSLMVAESAAVLGSAHTSVWVQDAATLELVGRAEHRKDGGPLEATQTRYSAELAKRFFSDDAPFAISRAQLETLDGVPPVDADYAVAPFVLDDGRRGCLVAALPADRRYDERDLRLLGGLAHQARLAIGNVGGNRHLENAFVATLERVAATLGVLVPDAASGREVADVALAVGRDLGLDDQALRRLELAALFRDVGNIGVPAAVLEKPDRLAAAERRLVERHVELGEQVVEPVESLREVARLVRHSHERWDGAGYPDGLAGEAIPLESRIVHVCDAFHAITSERPYRGRLPVDEALRRLEAGAGTQFDPAVVLRAVRLVRAGRI